MNLLLAFCGLAESTSFSGQKPEVVRLGLTGTSLSLDLKGRDPSSLWQPFSFLVFSGSLHLTH